MLGSLQIRRGAEVLRAQQLGGPKSRQILEILLLHLGLGGIKGNTHRHAVDGMRAVDRGFNP